MALHNCFYTYISRNNVYLYDLAHNVGDFLADPIDNVKWFFADILRDFLLINKAVDKTVVNGTDLKHTQNNKI